MHFHTLATQAAAQSPTSAINIVKLAATIVVALAAVATTIIAAKARKTVNTIHVLVNSKMTAALAQIDTLTAALEVQAHLPAVPDTATVGKPEEPEGTGAASV
jgi:hypothetical protein